MCIDPSVPLVFVSVATLKINANHGQIPKKVSFLHLQLIKKLCMKIIEVDIFCSENNALKAPKYAFIKGVRLRKKSGLDLNLCFYIFAGKKTCHK